MAVFGGVVSTCSTGSINGWPSAISFGSQPWRRHHHQLPQRDRLVAACGLWSAFSGGRSDHAASLIVPREVDSRSFGVAGQPEHGINQVTYASAPA